MALDSSGHTGAMIALVVPDPETYALPSQEGDDLAPGELHITLGYLGEASEINEEQRAAILDAVQTLADTSQAPEALFPATQGVFPPDPESTDEVAKAPYFAAPSNAERFNELREDLLIHLGSRGVGDLVSTKHPVFNPHVTLTYAPLDTPPDLSHLPTPMPTTFSDLVVKFGDEQHEFRLNTLDQGPELPLTASVRATIARLSYTHEISEEYLTALYLRQRQVQATPARTRAHAALDAVVASIDPAFREDSYARVKELTNRVHLEPNPAGQAFIAARALALAARTPAPKDVSQARELAALTASMRALIADGNSTTARSLRAQAQLRDRYGRWIEQGGGVRFKVRVPGAPGGGTWYHGIVQGFDMAAKRVLVKLEDGRVVKIPNDKVEQPKAILGLNIGEKLKSFIPKSRDRVTDATSPKHKAKLANEEVQGKLDDAAVAAMDRLQTQLDGQTPDDKPVTGGHITRFAVSQQVTDALEAEPDADVVGAQGPVAPFKDKVYAVTAADIKDVRAALDARTQSALPDDYDSLDPEAQKKAYSKASGIAIASLGGLSNDSKDADAKELRKAPSVGTDKDLELADPTDEGDNPATPGVEEIITATNEAFQELVKRVPDDSPLAAARDRIGKSLNSSNDRLLMGDDDYDTYMANLDKIKNFANQQEPAGKNKSDEQMAFGSFAEDIDDVHTSGGGSDEFNAVSEILATLDMAIEDASTQDGDNGPVGTSVEHADLQGTIDKIAGKLQAGDYLDKPAELKKDLVALSDDAEAADFDTDVSDEYVDKLNGLIANTPDGNPDTSEAPTAPEADVEIPGDPEDYTDAPANAQAAETAAWDAFSELTGTLYDLTFDPTTDESSTDHLGEESQAVLSDLQTALDEWYIAASNGPVDPAEISVHTGSVESAAKSLAESLTGYDEDSKTSHDIDDASTDFVNKSDAFVAELKGNTTPDAAQAPDPVDLPSFDDFANLYADFGDLYDSLDEFPNLQEQIAAIGNAVANVGKDLDQGKITHTEAIDALDGIVGELDSAEQSNKPDQAIKDTLTGLTDNLNSIRDALSALDDLPDPLASEGDAPDSPESISSDPWANTPAVDAVVQDALDGSPADVVAESAPELVEPLADWEKELLGWKDQDGNPAEAIDSVVQTSDVYHSALETTSADPDAADEAKAIAAGESDRVEKFQTDIADAAEADGITAEDPATLVSDEANQAIIDQLNAQGSPIAKVIAQHLQGKVDAGEPLTEDDYTAIKGLIDFVAPAEENSAEDTADFINVADALDPANAAAPDPDPATEVPAVPEAPTPDAVPDTSTPASPETFNAPDALEMGPALDAWGDQLTQYLDDNGIESAVAPVKGQNWNKLSEAQAANLQGIIDGLPDQLSIPLQNVFDGHQGGKFADDVLVQAISTALLDLPGNSKARTQLKGAQAGIQTNNAPLVPILRPKPAAYGKGKEFTADELALPSPHQVKGTINAVIEQSAAGADLEYIKGGDGSTDDQVQKSIADAETFLTSAVDHFNEGGVDDMVSNMRSALDAYDQAIKLRSTVHKNDKIIRRLRARRRALDETLAPFEGRWPDPVNGGTYQKYAGAYDYNNSTSHTDAQGNAVYPGDQIERTHKTAKGQTAMVLGWRGDESTGYQAHLWLDAEKKDRPQGTAQNQFVIKAVGPNNPLFNDPTYTGPKVGDEIFNEFKSEQDKKVANQEKKAAKVAEAAPEAPEASANVPHTGMFNLLVGDIRAANNANAIKIVQGSLDVTKSITAAERKELQDLLDEKALGVMGPQTDNGDAVVNEAGQTVEDYTAEAWSEVIDWVDEYKDEFNGGVLPMLEANSVAINDYIAEAFKNDVDMNDLVEDIASRPEEFWTGKSSAAPAANDFTPLPKGEEGKSGDGYVVTPSGTKFWGKYGAAGIAITATDPADGKKKVLIGKRGDSDLWYLPGGAIDEKETPAQGVAREFHEEVTSPISDLNTLDHVGEHVFEDPEGTGWKYTTFVADAPAPFDVKANNPMPWELVEFTWASADDVEALEAKGVLHGNLGKGALIDKAGLDATPEPSGPDEDMTPEAAAEATPDVPPAATAAQVYDMTGWKTVAGNQGGYNTGNVMVDPDGNKYYVKTLQSEDHVHAEALASSMYQMLGVNTIDMKPGKDASGKLHTVSKWVDVTPGTKSISSDPEWFKKAQDGFAVDAWLGNYDVVGAGFGNMPSDANGDPVRVDNGSSFFYRGTGSKKTWWGDEVTDLKDMRTGASSKSHAYHSAAAVFGHMSEEDVKNSAKKLLLVSPQQITDMVNASGLSEDKKKKLAATMVKRRHDILTKTGLLNPVNDGNTPENASAAVDKGLDVLEDAKKIEVINDAKKNAKSTPPPEGWSMLSKDGVNDIEVGQKVTGGKGLDGEVVKVTHSGYYVQVKDADGKIKVRRPSTLTIQGATTPAEPDSTKPNYIFDDINQTILDAGTVEELDQLLKDMELKPGQKSMLTPGQRNSLINAAKNKKSVLESGTTPEPDVTPEPAASNVPGDGYLYTNNWHSFHVGNKVKVLDTTTGEWHDGTLLDEDMTHTSTVSYVMVDVGDSTPYMVDVNDVVTPEAYTAAASKPAATDTPVPSLGGTYAALPDGAVPLMKNTSYNGVLVQHADGSLHVYTPNGEHSNAYGHSVDVYKKNDQWVAYSPDPTGTPSDVEAPESMSLPLVGNMKAPPLGSKVVFKTNKPVLNDTMYIVETTDGKNTMYWGDGTVAPVHDLDQLLGLPGYAGNLDAVDNADIETSTDQPPTALPDGYAPLPAGAQIVGKSIVGGSDPIYLVQHNGKLWRFQADGSTHTALSDLDAYADFSSVWMVWNQSPGVGTPPEATPATPEPSVPTGPLSAQGGPIGIGDLITNKGGTKMGQVIKISESGQVTFLLQNPDGTPVLGSNGKQKKGTYNAGSVKVIAGGGSSTPSPTAAPASPYVAPKAGGDPSSPLYGADKPVSPTSPESKYGPYVTDDWITQAEVVFQAKRVEKGGQVKPIMSSSYAAGISHMQQTGNDNVLDTLLTKEYITQDLYDLAKSSIKVVKTQVDADMAVYNKDFAEYKKNLIAWNDANGVVPGLDPYVLQGSTKPFSGTTPDWDAAPVGTPTVSNALTSLQNADADLAKHGVWIAADGDAIEDLSIKLRKVIDMDGQFKIEAKFKMTAWQADQLKKALDARSDVTKDSTVGTKKQTPGTQGFMKVPSSYSGASWTGTGTTYSWTDPETGTRFEFVRGSTVSGNSSVGNIVGAKTPHAVNAVHNDVRVYMPADGGPETFEKALKALSIQQATPAPPESVRKYAENKLVAVFGGVKDPTKNLEGGALATKLAEIKTNYGIGVEDVRFGMDGRGQVKLYLSDEAAAKLANYYGNTHFMHSGNAFNSADTLTKVLSGPTAGMLPTATTFTEGVSAAGMSKSSDMNSGGAMNTFFYASQGTAHNGHGNLYIHPSTIAKSLNIFATPGDNYGNHAKSHDLPNALKQLNGGQYMIKGGVPVSDWWFVKVSASVREQTIKNLLALGITEINGIPVQEFIITSGMSSPTINPGVQSTANLSPVV